MALTRPSFAKRDARPLFEREVRFAVGVVWVASVLRVAAAIAHHEYLGGEVAIASLVVVVTVVHLLTRLVERRR